LKFGLPEKIRKDTEAENHSLPAWLDDRLQDIISHCVDVSFADFEQVQPSMLQSQEMSIDEDHAAKNIHYGNDRTLSQGKEPVLLSVEPPSFNISQRRSVSEQEPNVNLETGVTPWHFRTDTSTPPLSSREDEELSTIFNTSCTKVHDLEEPSTFTQPKSLNPAMIHFGFNDFQQYSDMLDTGYPPRRSEDNILTNPHLLGFPGDIDAAVFQDWFSLERPLDLPPGKEVVRALGPPSRYTQE
jgi:hypothetical protein